MRRIFWLAAALVLTFIICYSSDLTNLVYRQAAGRNFINLGTLHDFENICSSLSPSQRENCSVLYRLPFGQLLRGRSETPEILEVGAGVISGASEWFCSDGRKMLKIYENSSGASHSFFREGLMLYSTVTLPLPQCQHELVIKVSHDPRNFVATSGWKSGSLVLGPPTVVRSYKNVVDFFSSYLRILMSALCLLLLVVSRRAGQNEFRGYASYRRGLLFLSIHFLASSSLLDVIFPNVYGLGFVLLMAGGTAGCLNLVLSAFEATGLLSYNKPIPWKLAQVRRIIQSPILFLGLCAFYYFATGAPYLIIQGVLAIMLFAQGLAATAPAYILFGALFVSNVLAAFGMLPGYPTNTATHFILILFIIDSFEEVHVFNVLTVRQDLPQSRPVVYALTSFLARRFSLERLSTSMFTRDFEFVTKQLFFDHEVLVTVEKKVSHLAAHVMTSRRPLLRVRVGSEESRILKGIGSIENKQRGREFCIFPLVHSERVLGTLNLSGYPIWMLADPSQMFLFFSLVQRVVPRIAEIRYREDLSPNIDDQHGIREIEATFLSLGEKTKEEFLVAVSAIAKLIDSKALLSKALPEQDRFETFSQHHYEGEQARFLADHAPRLSNTLVASPANIAFHDHSTVFISDLEKMFSIYPEFLVQLLKANETRSLFVKPLFASDKTSEPWGVLWLEFKNRLGRPEADLRDLAESAAAAVQRMLLAFFGFASQQRFVNEIATTVPKHVLEKIRQNKNPREEEEGYLLNIDLAGSTILSEKVGSTRFAEIIRKMNSDLAGILSKYSFVPQIIVWDSFAFTRARDAGPPLTTSDAHAILKLIDTYLAFASQTLAEECQVSFRAILTYGDVTRDWSGVPAKYWTIVGNAYAESCKLEAELKPNRRVLLFTSSCPGNMKGDLIIRPEYEKNAA